MASTYTPLGIELQATGENAGTWGTKTNTNLQIFEQIAGGFTQQALTDGGTVALAPSDGATGAVMSHRMIEFTGTITGASTVTIPLDTQTFYFLRNSSSGAHNVVFKYATGSGSSITFSGTQKGDKIVFATANDGTNPDIKEIPLGISNVVEDTTPQLGGNLDANGNNILIDNGNFIGDENGLEQIKFATTASAVNELSVTNAATGNGPTLSATGGDTNVDLNVDPKGTGVLKSGSSAVKIAGKETMYVPAAAMYAATTNGAEATQTELTAGNPELKAFNFDATTAESVQFNVCFPKSWNEGTVTYQTFWSSNNTSTGTGGWKLSGVSIADNVDYDTSFGTAVANTAKAASGTQDDLMINDESGAVTIASAAADTNTVFKLERNVATDTNTGDLRLVGVKIFFTTDAANDA